MTVLAETVLAEKQPFERYQSIVDRQMFGPLPEGFDPTKSPSEVQKSSSAEEKALSKEQEKIQSAIHFSMINLTPDGKTAVGFTDSSDPKNPVNYYLKVGETRNGWTVKEADAQEATMTIVRDGIEVSLSIGGNSAKGAGTTARAGTAPANAGASAPAGRHRMGAFTTLRERRLWRKQEEKDAEAKRMKEQEEREAERQAQAEQDKLQREAALAEQRQQLLAIQEEMKRMREAKQAAEKKDNADGSEENQD